MYQFIPVDPIPLSPLMFVSLVIGLLMSPPWEVWLDSVHTSTNLTCSGLKLKLSPIFTTPHDSLAGCLRLSLCRKTSWHILVPGEMKFAGQ